MAPPNGGKTFELKLQVRYHGLKATQYFSKFTPESDNMFRDDLTSLKLPHPKRENTIFISYGCIECSWPAVQKDGVLHKHIAIKSKASEELLQELSISNITLKYIYPKKSQAHKNTNPHAKNLHHNYSLPQNHTAESSSGPSSLPNAHKKPFHPRYETWETSQRPHKMAKLDHGDVSTTSSGAEQPFPTFTHLPPLPPRKAPERIHVPTPSSSKAPRPSEPSQQSNNRVEDGTRRVDMPVPSTFSHNNFPAVGHPAASSISGVVGKSSAFYDPKRDELSASSNNNRGKILPKGPRAELYKTVYESPTPTPPLNARRGHSPDRDRRASPKQPRVSVGHYTKPAEPTNTQRIKQEHDEVSLEFLSEEAPQRPSTHADTPLVAPQQPERMRSRFEPADPPTPTEEKDDHAEKDKGALVVQDFLNSLKLKTKVGSQGPSSTSALQDNQSPQKIMLKSETQETRISPWQPQPYSQETHTPTSMPPMPERGSQRLDWYVSSEVPPFRGPQLDTMPSAFPTPPFSAAPFNLIVLPAVGQPPISASGASTQILLDVVKHALENPAPNPPPPPAPHKPLEPVPPVSQIPSGSSSSSIITSYPADGSPDTMKRRRNAAPRKEDSIAIQNLLREASGIKREIAAKIAREAVVIAELKELNSTWVPRHVKLGHETSEEVKAELARLRTELENERRLREEAESAIMDVRRECKEPFIVPSLLDAFVKLSKLTTRGLRPQPPQTDTDVDMSVAPMGRVSDF